MAVKSTVCIRKTFLLILISKTFICIDCHNFQPTNITRHNIPSCPGNENNPVHFNSTFAKISHNKVFISGELTFSKVITAPIEVFIL